MIHTHMCIYTRCTHHSSLLEFFVPGLPAPLVWLLHKAKDHTCLVHDKIWHVWQTQEMFVGRVLEPLSRLPELESSLRKEAVYRPCVFSVSSCDGLKSWNPKEATQRCRPAVPMTAAVSGSEERAHINSIMTPRRDLLKGLLAIISHTPLQVTVSQELPIRTDVFPGFGAGVQTLSPVALRDHAAGRRDGFPSSWMSRPLARAVLPQPQPNKVILYPATGRVGDRAVQCCLGGLHGKARGESHWPFLSLSTDGCLAAGKGALMGLGWDMEGCQGPDPWAFEFRLKGLQGQLCAE